MSQETKRITVAVAGHWLLGELPLAGSRIQETLNDSRTEFISLTHVEVRPLANRNSAVDLPEVMIPKTNIHVVAVPTSQHEAPEKRWNNRRAKMSFRTFAIAQDYRAWGDLHLPSTPNGLAFTFTQQLSQFFALTDAKFSLGDEQVCVPLLLVNKEVVSCLHVGETAKLESAPVDELSRNGL